MSYFSEGQLAAIIGSPISKPPYGMPKSIPLCKTAEELLKKALEFATRGMEETKDKVYTPYFEGKNFAYEDMAAHLEMLIKEVKNAQSKMY